MTETCLSRIQCVEKNKSEQRNCSWSVSLRTFLCNVTFQIFKDLQRDSRHLLFSLFSPLYVWDTDLFLLLCKYQCLLFVFMLGIWIQIP